MPRGGRRNGKPGASYPNRSDLAKQPVRTAPGQPYGAAGKQADAQRAIPLPSTPTPSPTAPAPQNAPFAPPEPGLLGAPTARPSEPVTAGLPIGAGPGPEAINAPGLHNASIDQLRALYQAFPVEEVRQIIERFESERGLLR